MPGNGRVWEVKLLRQRSPNPQTGVVGPERCQGPGSPAELDGNAAFPNISQSLGVTDDARQVDCTLIPESAGQGVLQMSSPCHRRVSMRFGQLCQGFYELF